MTKSCGEEADKSDISSIRLTVSPFRMKEALLGHARVDVSSLYYRFDGIYSSEHDSSARPATRCGDPDFFLSFSLACRLATTKTKTCHYAIALLSSDSCLRPSGKQYATTYAASEVQVGIAVTRPPCNDDLWAIATRPMQTLARAIVKRMYLHWSD
jgi:hypothetical protein